MCVLFAGISFFVAAVLRGLDVVLAFLVFSAMWISSFEPFQQAGGLSLGYKNCPVSPKSMVRKESLS
jgi:hypothetical protein